MGRGKVFPSATMASPFSPTPSTGDGSGTAFTETCSKLASQVLPAKPSLPTPVTPPHKDLAVSDFSCSEVFSSTTNYSLSTLNSPSTLFLIRIFFSISPCSLNRYGPIHSSHCSSDFSAAAIFSCFTQPAF